MEPHPRSAQPRGQAPPGGGLGSEAWGLYLEPPIEAATPLFINGTYNVRYSICRASLVAMARNQPAPAKHIGGDSLTVACPDSFDPGFIKDAPDIVCVLPTYIPGGYLVDTPLKTMGFSLCVLREFLKSNSWLFGFAI